MIVLSRSGMAGEAAICLGENKASTRGAVRVLGTYSVVLPRDT